MPEALLRKPGPLTAAEWVEMRGHPELGARIVEPLKLGGLVAPIVRADHERFDGSGYPYGLAGADIPIGARIVSVVDAFDAMDVAIAELHRFAGRQFDPELVELFVARRDQLTSEPELLLAPLIRGFASLER